MTSIRTALGMHIFKEELILLWFIYLERRVNCECIPQPNQKLLRRAKLL